MLSRMSSAQLLDDVRPLGVDAPVLLLIGGILLALGLLFAVVGRGRRRASRTPASTAPGRAPQPPADNPDR